MKGIIPTVMFASVLVLALVYFSPHGKEYDWNEFRVGEKLDTSKCSSCCRIVRSYTWGDTYRISGVFLDWMSVTVNKNGEIISTYRRW